MEPFYKMRTSVAPSEQHTLFTPPYWSSQLLELSRTTSFVGFVLVFIFLCGSSL